MTFNPQHQKPIQKKKNNTSCGLYRIKISTLKDLVLKTQRQVTHRDKILANTYFIKYLYSVYTKIHKTKKNH